MNELDFNVLTARVVRNAAVQLGFCLGAGVRDGLKQDPIDTMIGLCDGKWELLSGAQKARLAGIVGSLIYTAAAAAECFPAEHTQMDDVETFTCRCGRTFTGTRDEAGELDWNLGEENSCRHCWQTYASTFAPVGHTCREDCEVRA